MTKLSDCIIQAMLVRQDVLDVGIRDRLHVLEDSIYERLGSIERNRDGHQGRSGVGQVEIPSANLAEKRGAQLNFPVSME